MTSSVQVHPVAAFYGGARAMRWIGGALRAAHRVAPALGTSLALRVFFTPMPPKTVARRRAVPAPWRSHRFPFEGLRCVLWRRAEIAAADPQRPPVLLVHGWAGDAMQMRMLADTLAQAGFAPLLLDFPAHGRSDGWRSSLPQFVRTLFAVQARVGPLHAVVAHSAGALAAAHAVAKGLAAQRLVLLSPSVSPARIVEGFAHGLGIGPALARRMQHRIEGLEGMPLEQFEPAWLGERLVQPTLIVHDRADRVVPLAAAVGLAQGLPDARLLVTDDLGHRRGLGDAAVMAAVASHLRPRDTLGGVGSCVAGAAWAPRKTEGNPPVPAHAGVAVSPWHK